MSGAVPHVVVTGAAGFVGSRLVTRLLTHPAFVQARFSLNDLSLSGSVDARARSVPGDLGDAAVRDALIDGGADIVYHLGGMLGGAAERDPTRARAVNIDATLALFEALADPTSPPRVVFASSIAVFAAPFPAIIDDATPTNPLMLYGAHKAMIEIALEQLSGRGQIDGLALRLPGIVVKPGADARMKAAFISRIFEAFAAGIDVVMPVPSDGTTWLLSSSGCIDALVHAGLLAAHRLGRRRAMTLPAQCVCFGELVAALESRFPQSTTKTRFEPDDEITRLFGCQPPISTELADGLGFVHDGDLATLVARGIKELAL